MEQAKTYAIFDVYKGSLALDEELAKFENTLKENFL
jgi:modulator of drug activity B